MSVLRGSNALSLRGPDVLRSLDSAANQNFTRISILKVVFEDFRVLVGSVDSESLRKDGGRGEVPGNNDALAKGRESFLGGNAS